MKRRRKEYLVLRGETEEAMSLLGVFSSRKRAVLALSVDSTRLAEGIAEAHIERMGRRFRLVRPGQKDSLYLVEPVFEDGDDTMLCNKIKM